MTDEMDFDTPLTVLDRSTLEVWATCPMQGRLIADGIGRSVGRAAIIGQELHDAIARTVRSYVCSQGILRRSDLVDELAMNLRESRPDVQPDVIKAFRSSLWAWASFLEGTHFQNILRHDGGDGARSGQLSHDYAPLGVRITSEVDLLCATAAKEVVAEVDYKTGQKYWTADAWQNSFQGAFHAVLIFNNYPDVQCVQASVWNTRTNRLTYPTEFTRERLRDYDTRVQMAVTTWGRNKRLPMEQVEAFPSRDACSICNAAAACKVADRDIAQEPTEALRQLIAVEARADALRKFLGSRVDETGADIRVGGTCFGTDKPKSARKPTKSLYTVKGESDDDSDSE